MTLPTLPLVDPNQLAATGNLASLKQAAATNSPQALREAARQFESLFTGMMLKSMQEANFKDPLFGSDQGDLYQDMYDDQLAAVMSRGKGLGLADMLVQQLRREGTGAADSSGGSNSASGTGRGPAATSGTGSGAAGTATRPVTGTPGTAGARSTATAAGAAVTACPTTAQQAAFAHALWPDAQQAARQLGVNPVTLLAQAALETNWGRDVPQDGGGGTSNNLFGIKAGASWSGAAVSNSTQEYSGGTATAVKAQFRSYDSTSQCFQDYVGLLKANPRYAAALGTGNDVQAFGSALQQGGYATDPAYAGKLTAVAGTLTRALTQRLAGAVAPAAAAGTGSGPSGSLKFAANLPTTSGSGTLQRR
ncbi:MAG TPA: flagellar assembly peptidoglycan hydrolase FlgJ [Steroidobacteraceae bacterium]|nr:flagellar assembly peptidoglycan hydrolase FlgJ [Steroidobacteraceae bacterium]